MVRLALNIMPSSEELGQFTLSLSRRRCHETGRRQGLRTPATTAGLPKLDSRLYSVIIRASTGASRLPKLDSRLPKLDSRLPKLDSRLSANGIGGGAFWKNRAAGVPHRRRGMSDNTRHTGPIHTSVSYLICINAPERGVPTPATRKSRKAVHAQVDGIHSLISLAFSPRDKESKSNGATSLRAARVRPRALSCLVSREKKSHLSLDAYRKVRCWYLKICDRHI